MDEQSRAKLIRRIEKHSMPEPNSGCWIWVGCLTPTGYGHVYIRKGKNRRAHRASWEVYRGEIPTGLSVLHSCDMPPCVNPDHLFLGTQEDNMVDMTRKGRNVAHPGSRHGNSKLTEADVLAMRNSGATHNELARMYGINPNHVRLIRKNLVWRHV